MAAITCASCGRLNFTSDAKCDECRASRAPAVAAQTPHPFLTQSRSTAATGRPTTGAPKQQRLQWTVRRRQLSDNNGNKASNAGGTGAVETPVRINPPGWSVLRGSTTESNSTSTTASAAATTTSSEADTTTGLIGNKRPRAEKKQKKEVIDLISSDEDEEDEDMRAAVQALIEVVQEEAAQATKSTEDKGKEDNSEEDRQEIKTRTREDGDTVDDGHEADERIRAPVLARCFEYISYDIQDFPTEAQMAELARQAKQEAVPRAAPDLQPEASVETSQSVPPDTNTTRISENESPGRSEPDSKVTTFSQSGTEAVGANSVKSTVSHPTVPSLSRLEQANGSTVSTTSTINASVTSNTPTSMSQPIVLDDSEEEEVQEEFERGEFDGRALFQSRRFDSVAFNHIDFVSLHDGLNVARRSGPFVAPEATNGGIQDHATNGENQDHTSISTRSNGQGDSTTTSETANNETHTADIVSDQASADVITSDVITSTEDNESKDASAHDMKARGPPAQEPPPSSVASAPPTNILEPRRKNGERVSAATQPPAEIVIKQESTPANTTVAVSVRIIKPALGHCSVDFLRFMRECVEDDSEEDYEELVRARLLDVVDLTSLTDESEDDDDEDEEEEEDVLDVTADEVARLRLLAASSTTTASSIPNAPGAASGASSGGMNLSMSSVPVVKQKRAPRPKEICILCEEKAWIKALVHCSECKKYYHKRCAREYGDENVCWNCDLDGMIDDSELTDDHKQEIVGMFSAFRSPSDSESGEEEGEENEDADGYFEENARPPTPTIGTPLQVPALGSRTTKSMRRWKEFLEVATSKVDRSFEEVTNRIARELEDEERRTVYSKGFATKESVEAAMAEVVDHYANLQEKEERLRATTPATGDASTEPPVDSVLPTDPPPHSADVQSGDLVLAG